MSGCFTAGMGMTEIGRAEVGRDAGRVGLSSVITPNV